MFSTITVNTLSDDTTSDNFMSLREAIELMDAGGNSTTALGRSLTSAELAQIDTTDAFGTNNTIIFDDALGGSAIDLLSTLNIDGAMTIDAGDDGITLNGGGSSSTYRALTIDNGADVTIDGLTVTNFRAETMAGAVMVNFNAVLTVRNSVFSQNETFGVDVSGLIGAAGFAYGGAMLSNGTLTIIDSTFSDNAANGGDVNVILIGFTMTAGQARGGAIFVGDGTTTIQGSTFYGNTATGGSSTGPGGSIAAGADGSAIYLNNAALDITNSTITNNTATGGTGPVQDGEAQGAVAAIDGTTLTMDFTTVSDNIGQETRNVYLVQTDVTITNSIIGQADNSIVDLVFIGVGSLTGSNNMVRNTAATGFGNISTADPLLNALADNGGPTLTMRPQAGSDAINAAGATVLTTDQRGRARVVGGAADLGAVEAAWAPMVTNAAGTTFIAGQAATFTFTTATDGVTPALSASGTLPAGVTFTDNGDGTATLAGTPTAAGVFSIDITAANGTSPDDDQVFTLTVNQAPTITSSAAATFNVGRAGSFQVIATGVPTAALSYTGALPVGITFTDNGDGTASIAGAADLAAVGDHTITITADNNAGSNAQQTFTLTIVNTPTTVTTSGGGSGGLIVVKDADGTELYSVPNPFTGSTTPRPIATTATGDLIIATGAGVKATVLVYRYGASVEHATLEPFGNYRGGVFVAAGDVNHDGVDDIIVSAGKRAGSKASIKVYDGVTYGLIADIWAFNNGQSIRLASADLDGDGYAEVVATRGNKVRVFDGHDLSANTATIKSQFKAFNGYTGGLFVAAGDIDNDHQADIIVSQAAGNRPRIVVFNGDDSTLQKKLRVTAFNGTPISSLDFDNDGHHDLFAVVKNGNRNAVRVFSGLDDSILSTVDADEKGRLFIA